MSTRTLQQVIPSIAVSDGAGVKLRRSLGQSPALRVDPFLMLDEFSSDDPNDYIAGFPAHPHRGFETVTYMLEGHFLHEDNLGHRGDLRSGGVQWMTAGRGIIHSEMPQQEHGRVHGFQLWINLPAREKMKPAAYRDLQPESIPQVELAGGGSARVIAGTLDDGDRRVDGPMQGLSTAPRYFDVRLPAGARFAQDIPAGHAVLAYPYVGNLLVGPAADARPLRARSAGIFSFGTRIEVAAGEQEARFLLLAAQPIREPIAQYGPFVMNTREEIEQAIADYQHGTLVEAPVR